MTANMQNCLKKVKLIFHHEKLFLSYCYVDGMKISIFFFFFILIRNSDFISSDQLMMLKSNEAFSLIHSFPYFN